MNGEALKIEITIVAIIFLLCSHEHENGWLLGMTNSLVYSRHWNAFVREIEYDTYLAQKQSSLLESCAFN